MNPNLIYSDMGRYDVISLPPPHNLFACVMCHFLPLLQQSIGCQEGAFSYSYPFTGSNTTQTVLCNLNSSRLPLLLVIYLREMQLQDYRVYIQVLFDFLLSLIILKIKNIKCMTQDILLGMLRSFSPLSQYSELKKISLDRSSNYI